MNIKILPKILDANEMDILYEGLYQEARKAKNLEKGSPVGFLVKNDKDEIIGGIAGFSYYGCHHIDTLWVHPDFRKQGLGSQLVQRVEQLGIERKCLFMTVNTMDWEALSFYQKLGFEIEFVRTGYEKESKFYFLKKPLSQNNG